MPTVIIVQLGDQKESSDFAAVKVPEVPYVGAVVNVPVKSPNVLIAKGNGRTLVGHSWKVVNYFGNRRIKFCNGCGDEEAIAQVFQVA